MDKKQAQHRTEELEQLRLWLSSNAAALDDFYEKHRQAFLRFANPYQLDDADVIDAYQDAIIILFEQVQSGKLSQLTSSLQTYLFAIGKRKLIDQLRKKNRQFALGESVVPEPLDESIFESIELNHRQKLLKESIDELGEKCKEILLLFYYRRYSIESIRLEMD